MTSLLPFSEITNHIEAPSLYPKTLWAFPSKHAEEDDDMEEDDLDEKESIDEETDVLGDGIFEELDDDEIDEEFEDEDIEVQANSMDDFDDDL